MKSWDGFGSCKMTNVHSVSLMAFRGSYFLLLHEFRKVSFKHRAWVWHPVGGKVKPSETPLEALDRKWRKETGLPIIFPPLDTYVDLEVGGNKIHRFYIWRIKGRPLDLSGFVATETTKKIAFRKYDSPGMSDLSGKFIRGVI